MNKQIINLYDHYKNTPKKLKIVCDWDEVIQPCEPYACYLTMRVGLKKIDEEIIDKEITLEKFPSYFKHFWLESDFTVSYSPYGSKLEYGEVLFGERAKKDLLNQQSQIKNSPNFYQETPFLTIAEDLLKLIKEDKVEKLIFLSAYDKRKFPYGDKRKYDIFTETFEQLSLQDGSAIVSNFRGGGIATTGKLPICSLQLIPFDSEIQGQTKADWIKKNASDFDIVIDDNPNICRSLMEMKEDYQQDWRDHQDECMGCSECHEWSDVWEKWKMTIITPCYPTIENQHHKEVLLIKNEVSELRKEEFNR